MTGGEDAMPKETKFTLLLLLVLGTAFGVVVWQRVEHQKELVAAMKDEKGSGQGRFPPGSRSSDAPSPFQQNPLEQRGRSESPFDRDGERRSFESPRRGEEGRREEERTAGRGGVSPASGQFQRRDDRDASFPRGSDSPAPSRVAGSSPFDQSEPLPNAPRNQPPRPERSGPPEPEGQFEPGQFQPRRMAGQDAPRSPFEDAPATPDRRSADAPAGGGLNPFDGVQVPQAHHVAKPASSADAPQPDHDPRRKSPFPDSPPPQGFPSGAPRPAQTAGVSNPFDDAPRGAPGRPDSPRPDSPRPESPRHDSHHSHSSRPESRQTAMNPFDERGDAPPTATPRPSRENNPFNQGIPMGRDSAQFEPPVPSGQTSPFDQAELPVRQAREEKRSGGFNPFTPVEHTEPKPDAPAQGNSNPFDGVPIPAPQPKPGQGGFPKGEAPAQPGAPTPKSPFEDAPGLPSPPKKSPFDEASGSLPSPKPVPAPIPSPGPAPQPVPKPAPEPQRPRETTPAPAPSSNPFQDSPLPPGPHEESSPPRGPAPRPLPGPAPQPDHQGPVRVYTVQPDETYWSISRKLYGTIRYFQALAEYNRHRVGDPKRLRPGMKILVPEADVLEQQYARFLPAGSAPRGGTPDEPQEEGLFFTNSGQPMYRVGSEDTLGSIAQRHLGRTTRWVEIYNMNKNVLSTPDRLKLGVVLKMPSDASRIVYASDSRYVR